MSLALGTEPRTELLTITEEPRADVQRPHGVAWYRTPLPSEELGCLHMNFHIEHHRYATVPCCRLGKLHRLIQHDLTPCPRGLLATWKQIAAIQETQTHDPESQYAAPCSNPRPRMVDRLVTSPPKAWMN